MTWFFFKAGMFHKGGDSATFIRKSFRRLMVPYLVCLLTGHLIDTAVFLYRHGGLSGSILFNHIFSRWFLRRIPVLTRIGAHSMTHYLVHYPVLSIMAYVLYGGTSYGTWGMTPRFLAMVGIIVATMALSEGVITLRKRRRSP